MIKFPVISLHGFYIIEFIMYIIIFSGTALSFLKFRQNISGKKIMLLGLCLIILGFGFMSVTAFQFSFRLLDFLILLLGIILIFLGFCFKD